MIVNYVEFVVYGVVWIIVVKVAFQIDKLLKVQFLVVIIDEVIDNDQFYMFVS